MRKFSSADRGFATTESDSSSVTTSSIAFDRAAGDFHIFATTERDPSSETFSSIAFDRAARDFHIFDIMDVHAAALTGVITVGVFLDSSAREVEAISIINRDSSANFGGIFCDCRSIKRDVGKTRIHASTESFIFGMNRIIAGYLSTGQGNGHRSTFSSPNAYRTTTLVAVVLLKSSAGNADTVAAVNRNRCVEALIHAFRQGAGSISDIVPRKVSAPSHVEFAVFDEDDRSGERCVVDRSGSEIQRSAVHHDS